MMEVNTSDKLTAVLERTENGLFELDRTVHQLADRGDLPCPRCGQPLSASHLNEPGIYAGVILICLRGCGEFREY